MFICVAPLKEKNVKVLHRRRGHEKVQLNMMNSTHVPQYSLSLFECYFLLHSSFLLVSLLFLTC